MFSGSIVSIITPFTAEREIDEEALRELIAWHVQEGADALVCCGVTGEAPTLTDQEQLRVIQIAVAETKGAFPIIAGTGTYDTRLTIARTRAAQEGGAEGCLLIVPYYNRPTPEGCIAHYRAIAKVGLPMIVYNHPSRTATKLNASTLATIAEIPEVVGFKEGSGDIDLVLELKRFTDKAIFSGDDVMTIPLMSVGGVGVISTVANLIPREWKLLVAACKEGNYEKARSLLAYYYPLCKSLFIETNPQCVKYALSLLGKCNPYLRLPLVEPQDTTKLAIRQALSKVIPATI